MPKGGEAVPYLIFLAILGIWAWFALRDRPVAYYLSMWFACSLMTAAAEPTFSRLLRLYRWRLQLEPHLKHDVILASMVIAFCLDPLLGVLFARYAATRPVLKAVGAALLLGVFEVWLHAHGYMIYRAWSPILTVLAFCTYFLLVWRLTLRPWPISHGLHVYGFTIWMLYFWDVSLQGYLELWHFNVRWWDWERFLSVSLHALVFAPMATLIAVRPLTRRWLWGAGALGSLVAVAFLLKAVGLAEFGWPGLLAVLIDYSINMWLAVQYSQWLRRHEPRPAPPPWEPPVLLK